MPEELVCIHYATGKITMAIPHFQFLQVEWPALYIEAAKAESLVYGDARSACFYARRTLELAVTWLYQAEGGKNGSLKLPYKSDLNAFLYEPTFKTLVGPALHTKLDIIRRLGNEAAHSTRSLTLQDALASVRELFHFCFWLGRQYARTAQGKPLPGATFDAKQLPQTSPIPPQTQLQLQALSQQLQEKDAQLATLQGSRVALDEELARLRAEIAAAKQKNAAVPDTHDYSEEETRDTFIDLLLKEAGWKLDQPQDREYEVTSMPNQQNKGYVDYVLWGDDYKPLAVVEAKRTRRDPRVGQQQAKLYADCLEQQFGQRPVIFYSNGYEHWLWDDLQYPPRPVQDFYKKAELELMVQRRTTRLSLASVEINPSIAERYYQTRAIRRIGEAFEKNHERRALLVMATGAGKTRTVIALCDLLMRCNWVKRVLFLADRVALVNQAVNVFKTQLPDASPVNLVTDKNAEGRVYVSTYPTMMGLIDAAKDGKGGSGQRRFGVGHFDLIVIDEAHRSIYQRYGAIFNYFDSFLVGLTATPRGEVDRNTYRLFALEDGVPTDVYDIDDAVNDGFLVPPRSVSVPLKFQRQGIRYDDLSEDEKDEWDAIEWGEDEDGNAIAPTEINAEQVNTWLFNTDTVDKVLAHLMMRGQKVAGGDVLGKTIIFAKNQSHADFIAARFNINYPQYNGTFARVITFKVEYAQSLIDTFSIPTKEPHIAISVDMLDTGIDVPEAVNLVFFKLVRSKTKFWQMLGRGTRLCPNLFGLDKHKEFFYIFDYCQNLEFFNQDMEATDGALGASLSKRLFVGRLELVGELDKALIYQINQATEWNESGLRMSTAQRLYEEVAAMNMDNFVVRPKRRLVERYADLKAWERLSAEQRNELANEVAGLPSELEDRDQDAKQFDLLMLQLQLALLRAEPAYARLKVKVQAIASALSELDSIPMVRTQMALIQDLMTDAYWENITTPMMESIRKKLRGLVKLIERRRRQPVYTDFEDEIGAEIVIDLPGFTQGGDFERFRAKARKFLQAHKDHLAIYKLRCNEPLTSTDLSELERMLVEFGATTEDLDHAKTEAHGLGLFLRSLVGLDREAAKHAFDNFLTGKTPTANQIEFINLVIEHLTQQGVMDETLLYESPYTDFSPLGVEGVFNSAQVTELFSILKEIRARAAA